MNNSTLHSSEVLLREAGAEPPYVMFSSGRGKPYVWGNWVIIFLPHQLIDIYVALDHLNLFWREFVQREWRSRWN